MKQILTGVAFLITQLTYAQTYSEQLDKAEEAVLKKDYCTALTYFKSAFKDTSKIEIYDFYYAALSAANCKEEPQAFIWLKKSQQKGLEVKAGEVKAITNDNQFVILHKFPEWKSFVTAMEKAFRKNQQLQKSNAKSGC